MYKQTVEPELDPYIYQNGAVLSDWLGWCLAYVNTAFNAGWAGSTAREGWDNSAGKHEDMNIPSGVYVPIWFNHYGDYGYGYKNYGHVAIWKDGTIWTSPYTHKPYADVFTDINALCSMYNCTYIGWTEYVGPTRVIEPTQDVPPPPLASNQRQVGDTKVNYRQAPDSNSPQLITDVITDGYVDAGVVANLQGFEYGESVYGNNIWYKGIGGGYMWSGAFTSQSLEGLPNLTPNQTPTPPITPPAPAPDTSKYVIDVSAHNTITDYATVISNVRGAIAKAGHTGKSYGGTPLNGDPKFNDYKANFGTKLNGAYWYAYCSLNAVDEATNFVKSVGVVPDNFTYWLDIEETDDQSNDKVNIWCQIFLNEIDKQTKRVCGLYMNRNWFDNIITQDTKSARPIWLAHYGIGEFTSPVTNQVAHQFTSSGKVAGYDGNLDLNAVKEEFFTPAKIEVKPPVVEPPIVIPPVTPPEPEKPPVEPPVASQTLLEFIKQLISKLTTWLSQWRKDK